MSQNFSGDDITCNYMEAYKKLWVKKRSQAVIKNWHIQHQHPTQFCIGDIYGACCVRLFVTIMSPKISQVTTFHITTWRRTKNYEWTNVAKLLKRIGIFSTNTPTQICIDDIYGACRVRLFLTSRSQDFSGDDIPYKYMEAGEQKLRVKKGSQPVKNWHTQHPYPVFYWWYMGRVVCACLTPLFHKIAQVTTFRIYILRCTKTYELEKCTSRTPTPPPIFILII